MIGLDNRQLFGAQTHLLAGLTAIVYCADRILSASLDEYTESLKFYKEVNGEDQLKLWERVRCTCVELEHGEAKSERHSSRKHKTRALPRCASRYLLDRLRLDML